MPVNIVLVEPEIHTNTGNIGRLSLASGSNLHLIKPFGFELSDSRLKRAGLDYWKHISLFIYEDFQDFIDKNKNELIWQGIGSGALKMSNMDKKEERINEFVNKIISVYPPNLKK